jgi:hypothetical protein
MVCGSRFLDKLTRTILAKVQSQLLRHNIPWQVVVVVDLEVHLEDPCHGNSISRTSRFKEFNREKKQQQKHQICLKSFQE